MFGRSAAKSIRVQVFGKTDVGRTREHNEDRFLVADLTRKDASLLPQVRQHDLGERGSLFVVADGMGGAAAGELASQMATDTIFAHLLRAWIAETEATPQRFAHRLKEAVEVANSSIHAHAKAHPEVKGMGTTTTAAGVLGDHLYLTQVGDSRAYLVRGSSIRQLTSDHTFVNEQVRAGALSASEARRHPARNILTRAVGSQEEVEPDMVEQDLKAGDIILLCSDGLTTMAEDDDILETVAAHSDDPEAGCRALVDLANERGGDDNVTVVLVRAVPTSSRSN